MRINAIRKAIWISAIIPLIIFVGNVGYSFNTGEGGHGGLAEKSIGLKKSLNAGGGWIRNLLRS